MFEHLERNMNNMRAGPLRAGNVRKRSMLPISNRASAKSTQRRWNYSSLRHPSLVDLGPKLVVLELSLG